MLFSGRFRQGMRAAVPIWIAFVPSFMSGARFDAAAAPYRGLALAVIIFIAHKTKRPVMGMFIVVLVVLVTSRLR